MSLTIIETKKSVSFVMPGEWNVTRNLVLKDGEVEVLNQDFSLSYKTGDDITSLAAKFKELEQEAIDRYKDEQAVFTHQKMDDMTTYLNANLTV